MNEESNEGSISLRKEIRIFIQKNRSTINKYILLSLLSSIIDIILAYLYGKITSVINDEKSINDEVKKYFTYIIVAMVFRQVISSAMLNMDVHFRPMLRHHFRQRIVDRVLSTYNENYKEEELGGILTQIVSVPSEIDHLFVKIRTYTIPLTFTLLLSLGYFTYVNTKLGLLSTGVVTVYIFIALALGKKCNPHTTKLSKDYFNLQGEINDCFGNAFNIYTSNQKDEEMKRLEGFDNTLKHSHENRLTCIKSFKGIMGILSIVLFFTINLYSFQLFSKGKIKLNDVVTALIISLEILYKLSVLITSVDKISYQFTFIDYFEGELKKLGRKETSTKDAVKFDSPPLSGDIVLDNVNLKYNDKDILKNVSFTIPYNSTTILVGEIGSGKTSIINSIMRLTPYTGNIYINGYNIKNINLKYLRGQILYVPQNPRLFNRSIYENIAYGNNITKNDVHSVLHLYGIHLNIERNAGKFGSNLSGGQRQIVYLLRCLFRTAPIVIMDEPTASLDSETKEYIMNILNDMLQNKTVIIVTHDSDVYRFANHIIEMSKGVVVSEK